MSDQKLFESMRRRAYLAFAAKDKTGERADRDDPRISRLIIAYCQADQRIKGHRKQNIIDQLQVMKAHAVGAFARAKGPTMECALPIHIEAAALVDQQLETHRNRRRAEEDYAPVGRGRGLGPRVPGNGR